jgi:hypothetical protein
MLGVNTNTTQTTHTRAWLPTEPTRELLTSNVIVKVFQKRLAFLIRPSRKPDDTANTAPINLAKPLHCPVQAATGIPVREHTVDVQPLATTVRVRADDRVFRFLVQNRVAHILHGLLAVRSVTGLCVHQQNHGRHHRGTHRCRTCRPPSFGLNALPAPCTAFMLDNTAFSPSDNASYAALVHANIVSLPYSGSSTPTKILPKLGRSMYELSVCHCVFARSMEAHPIPTDTTRKPIPFRQTLWGHPPLSQPVRFQGSHQGL